MEMELNHIIEKIKSEGVQEADSKAKEIVKDAESKASQIIKDAQVQSQKIIRPVFVSEY